MSIDQASPLVPIKPQVALQNSAFIKNSHNRSSFCGVSPSNGTFKTFAVNRKSWSGNVTLPLQQFTPEAEPAPQLATFRSGTGTFPRNRERNNNGTNGILTPNGNTVQSFKGNELRRSGCSNGRRYAEIGYWNKRNATFLEPHLQGVRRRDSRSSDSDHDERSTEDDERSLIRSSPRTRLPPPPPPPPDDEPPPLKPREFFERLQSQAMREAQDRKRPRDLMKEQLFRPVDTDGSLGDSLSQSRESLSSDGEGARGDCSSVDSSGSGSEEQPPCDIGLLERLIRTHPVWFLPGIQRAGAFHLLQGKEEGNFVVRQSSQPDTMAISVRLPADKGPYIEHYLIQASGGRIGLETSHNRFDNIPELIAHYCQCCDELPVQLQLPRALREAKSRHQLSSLTLLGQEFWGYPMANPKNNPNNLLSPCQLANGVVPMAITPSDTGSSLSSFNASTGTISREQILSPDKDKNVVLKMSPIDPPGSPPKQSQNLSTFKGRTPPSPPAKPTSAFVRAPRPTPPNTLNLMSSTAHITQPHTFPSTNTQLSPTLISVKTTPPPPPPRWAKPPFTKPLSPKSEALAFSPINKASQNGNITVTTTVTFSVNNTQIHNHQINENIQSDRLQLTLASNAINNNSADAVFNIMDASKQFADPDGETQNMMHRMSPEGECINAMTASLHGSFKRQMTEPNTTEPGSPVEQSQTNTSESIDPVVNSFTKSSSNGFAPNQLVSPNGTNSVTSGIFSPTSQINSPVSNDTFSSKSGVFSPISQTNKSELFSPVSRSSPISGKNVFSPTSNQSIVSPLICKDREKVLSPNSNTTSTTPSGRSRRSRHSQRKESRHYQESDILESPGVYYRSSLLDKVSDYEDIWGPESNNCSTFKPNKTENENNVNNGLMKSKKPDLLPDTLPKMNNAKSTQSILEKENIHILNSTESLIDKKNLSDSSLKKSFNGSSEIIATTNSKGDVVPKRPDKLNITMNMNKKLTEEIEASFKNRENYNAESMETVKLEDDCIKDPIGDDSEKDNTGSPFYADPVDALKEAGLPQVQRRKLIRVGMNLSQRYSEPPQNHPYYPLRDMHSIEELSPSSPNTSSSVDNLVSLRSKPKIKPVQPPRVNNKPPTGKTDQTWTVDSSWEFINKHDEGSNSESGTFPSLAEQECRLSVDDCAQHLTVHQVVAQRFPELRLNAEPIALPEEVRSPPRASCYDNVHDLRPLSEQASDDGTVFSEPWDSSQWGGLIPPPKGDQAYDTEEPCEWESPIPRRGSGTNSRGKSFRDRLDPLLAAGRVRALRGGRGSRGAGAALRAYALHLAQDKSTTFAQNIDNFIACTLDSKETCPQVMMRNMRQFMSGMKNYLVKHGEREFEKEVEKERLKLKPTEFLNIDAILEGVMHRLVVRPLRARLYARLAGWHAPDVRRLHAAVERAHRATPLQLGIKESTKVPSAAVLAVISKHFLKMQEADSPLDKLENLLAAISVMFNAIRGERALGADDLLPVLAWTVARCRLVCAELEAELMSGLLPAALLAGEGGYYLTALFSAVAVLKRLAPEPGPDSATPQWRRGSSDAADGGAAVVRVALPDECRGSIRRVALPCRPGARARDLCRALAHAAAITNPQDYALFALHDGQETMLNENDCPQEVMSEKSGQNFILAYKRIDAKIAWPQQALLSYP